MDVPPVFLVRVVRHEKIAVSVLPDLPDLRIYDITYQSLLLYSEMTPTAILELSIYLLRVYHKRHGYEAVAIWKNHGGKLLGAARVHYPSGEIVRMPTRKSIVAYLRYAYAGKGTPWTFNS